MDEIKSSKKDSKPRQKVKFEGEIKLVESNQGAKGWLDGDYKVGDINMAIVSVTNDRQV